jgi:hypothetical protein
MLLHEIYSTGATRGFLWGLQLLSRRWAFERTLVSVGGAPYLQRTILYLASWSVRLHRFYAPDDGRAPHNHPWSAGFVTIPLSGYTEDVYRRGRFVRSQYVAPWRWHYRDGDFEHAVMSADTLPFSTIVFTGPADQAWGFFPAPGVFVPWQKWTRASMATLGAHRKTASKW